MTQKEVHEELCDKALAHYKALSRKTGKWHSVIPNAIEFYRKFGRHYYCEDL